MAVKSDVKTGHDIADVTRIGDPPGTWEGRGCAARLAPGHTRRARRAVAHT